MKAPLLIGIASFLTSTALFVLLMQVPASAGWPVTILAYVVGAGAHGFAYGALLRRPCAVPAGCGALAAACLVSVPVVLVTYGLALIAAPVLAAFALLVAAAAHVGTLYGRRGHAV